MLLFLNVVKKTTLFRALREYFFKIFPIWVRVLGAEVEGSVLLYIVSGCLVDSHVN